MNANEARLLTEAAKLRHQKELLDKKRQEEIDQENENRRLLEKEVPHVMSAAYKAIEEATKKAKRIASIETSFSVVAQEVVKLLALQDFRVNVVCDLRKMRYSDDTPEEESWYYTIKIEW